MAADGVGTSRTCTHLASGIAAAGGRIEVMVNRIRGETCLAPMLSALPGPLAMLPYRQVEALATQRLEAWFLRRLRPQDIAWLWPSASLIIHEKVACRGNPIILEGINSRMAQAKEILDAAYDAFGTPPNHNITDARIAEEDAKISLATTIFAPNTLVERGLIGTRLEGCFLRSSYGVDTKQHCPGRTRPRPTSPIEPVVFMFCGFACVRKGIHHLLDIWPRLPGNAILRIVGKIEPVIQTRYAALLSSDRVEIIGFTHDVAQHYVNADVFVFTSLEEGGPQVCYEAAHFGLPGIYSAVGGGRIAENHNCGLVVDPADSDALEAALLALLTDPELRHTIGQAAHLAAKYYDWMEVGSRRSRQIAALLQ